MIIYSYKTKKFIYRLYFTIFIMLNTQTHWAEKGIKGIVRQPFFIDYQFQ